jgi:hypothetical protein
MGSPQVTASIAVALLVTVVIGVVVVLRTRRGRRDSVERDASDEEIRREVLENLARQVAEWDRAGEVAPLGGAPEVEPGEDPAPTTPPRAATVPPDGAAHLRTSRRRSIRRWRA